MANHHAKGVKREVRVAGGNAHEDATQGAEKHRCHCAQRLGECLGDALPDNLLEQVDRLQCGEAARAHYHAR